MVATTMEKITSLVKKLENSATHVPHLNTLTLQTGELFSWNHTACAITYNPNADYADAYLLHEYGHALLQHTEYAYGIELLKMEREAWDTALSLANTFDVEIHDDIVENALDTYRDWLHERSTCPNCRAIGIESRKQTYDCIACHTRWRVNEARDCSLRRYTTKKHLK